MFGLGRMGPNDVGVLINAQHRVLLVAIDDLTASYCLEECLSSVRAGPGANHPWPLVHAVRPVDGSLMCSTVRRSCGGGIHDSPPTPCSMLPNDCALLDVVT